MALVATTPCFVQRPDWSFGVSENVLRDFASSLDKDYVGTLQRFLALQLGNDGTGRSVIRKLRAGLFSGPKPAGETLRNGLRILLETDLRREVCNIQQPCLMLNGDKDALVPLAAARWLKRHLANSELRVVASGHAPFLSDPGTFVGALTEFLNG
jgi:pimeloyl-[acyl-carrier protein] methyl ester esterase